MSNILNSIDTGLLPIIFEPYEEALKTLFTMNIYPDMENKEVYETLVPVTGPPVLNLGTQQNLSPTKEKPKDQKQDQIVKLPALALTQLDWKMDLKRYRASPYRKLGWTEEGNRVIESESPVPIDVMYQLDCWTKYRSQMNQIVRNVILKFARREVWLSVDLGGVWGKKNIAVTYGYSSPTNMTEHEPKDKDRTIRMVFSFWLHAWIVPDAFSVPSVKKVYVQAKFPVSGNPPYPTEAADPNWVADPAGKILVYQVDPTDSNP